MKKILVDIDEVVCLNTYLDELNKWTGNDFKINDFTCYYIDDIIQDPVERYNFNASIATVDLYKGAYVYPGAVDVLKKLSEQYEVYFLSAYVNPYAVEESGVALQYKFDFVRKNFPFIDPSHIIFGGSKNIFDVDVQIDDKFKNLKNKTPIKLMFEAHHNKHFTEKELGEYSIKRVSSWADIEKILLK